jgi:hypothetical protein
MALRISYTAAIGAALGFLTLKVAIYYLHGFKGLSFASSGKREYAVLKEKKRRRKGIMKDIFGSPYDDDGEDEDGNGNDDEPGKD